MNQSRPALARGVVIENVGDHTLVLVGSPPQVVRLSPGAAELLLLIQQNRGNDFKQTAPLGELVELGVVEDTSPATLSRRGVIKISAVAGATGLSAVLLPTAAAASSETSPFDLTGTYEYFSGNVILRLDPGPVTKAEAGTLTLLSGFDNFGGSDAQWQTFDFSMPTSDQTLLSNGDPLVGTFTFDGNEYTVTFVEVTPG